MHFFANRSSHRSAKTIKKQLQWAENSSFFSAQEHLALLLHLQKRYNTKQLMFNRSPKRGGHKDVSNNEQEPIDFDASVPHPALSGHGQRHDVPEPH